MFGSKANALIEDAVVAWLTTVRSNGQAQSSPIWFVVDDGDFLIYSLTGTARTENIGRNPRVALNLDSDDGADVVTIEGMARIVDGPPSTEVESYQSKYRDHIPAIGHTPQSFSDRYPVVIRVRPTRWRVPGNTGKA